LTNQIDHIVSYRLLLLQIGSDGKLNPEKFHEHLSVGISASSKEKLKTIMTKHLKCWNPTKHPKLPCYTPLAFHKCWKDAVEYLCTTGMPKDNDFSEVPKVKVRLARLGSIR